MSKEHLIIKSKDRMLDNIMKEMLDILNYNIGKYDLTFEDSLIIAERIRLHLLAKYIDFRVRMLQLTSRLDMEDGKI